MFVHCIDREWYINIQLVNNEKGISVDRSTKFGLMEKSIASKTNLLDVNWCVLVHDYSCIPLLLTALD